MQLLTSQVSGPGSMPVPRNQIWQQRIHPGFETHGQQCHPKSKTEVPVAPQIVPLSNKSFKKTFSFRSSFQAESLPRLLSTFHVEIYRLYNMKRNIRFDG